MCCMYLHCNFVWKCMCRLTGFHTCLVTCRFNPSFILHWIYHSFLTELSRWMKVSIRCYNLDNSHRHNPSWPQTNTYTVTSTPAQTCGFVLSWSSLPQVNSQTVKRTLTVRVLKKITWIGYTQTQSAWLEQETNQGTVDVWSKAHSVVFEH